VKIAFIVQRYGREILGGAETLARQIAERLARRHEIEVLTTTARDYVTWRNEYPAGEEKLRNVQIHRFPVEGERDLEEFNRYSDWIYKNQHTRQDELKWLEMQGPVAPELIDYLRAEHGRFELLLFFTYLYYPTYYGLRIAPGKSALLPTAHDEPPLKLEIYKDMFGLPAGFLFNTEAEELLVLERFGVYKKMRETIGIGMELLDAPDASGFRRRNKLPGRYLLYAGRIDAGKGCDELLRFFRFYKEERPEMGNLHLVLIGKQSMRLPEARDIRYLGFLDDGDKFAAMAAATAVVVPSRMESLSIVALEAFSVGTPVIVSSGSKVLVDHSRTSNAGLYYSDYDEFEAILDLLLGDKNLARGMGKLGQKYIKENFGWEKLLNRYELTLRSLARPPRPVREKPSGKPQHARPRRDGPKTEEHRKQPAKSGEVDAPSKVIESEAQATKVVEPAVTGGETRAPEKAPETRPVAEPTREPEEPRRRTLPGEVLRRSRRGSRARGGRDSSRDSDAKSAATEERDEHASRDSKSEERPSKEESSAFAKPIKTAATADKPAGAKPATTTAPATAEASTKSKSMATADKPADRSAGAKPATTTAPATAEASTKSKSMATADKPADRSTGAKPESVDKPADKEGESSALSKGSGTTEAGAGGDESAGGSESVEKESAEQERQE